MHPVIINIFGIKIFSYGLMMAIGMMLGLWVCVYLAKKSGINSDEIFNLAFVVIIFSILGARLFYVAINLNYYLKHPIEIILLNKGGLVFYGGLIGGFLSGLYYVRKNNLPILKICDIFFTALPLGQAFGRVGCFLNGCCYGIPTNSNWGVIFPPHSLPFQHYKDFVLLHPVQLYNSSANFIIFLILFTIYDEKKFDGMIVCFYGLLYSTSRFLTEFYRGDMARHLGLTIAQWISIVFFLLSAFALFYLYNKKSGKDSF